MNKTFFISLLLILWTASDLQAQSESNYKNEIGLRVGFNFGYLNDSNFSPLNYKQSGLSFGLYYSRKKRNTFRVQLDFSPSKIKTDASEIFTASHLVGNLKLGYLFDVNDVDSKLAFQLGPQYQFNFNFVDFRNLFSFTAWISHNFNVAGGLKYAINDKQHIRANLAMPTIGLIVRPPYNGFDEALEERTKKPLELITNGKWMSWNKYQAIDFSLFYTYSFSDRFDSTIGYKFQYQRVADIHKLIYAQHQLVVGLSSKF